MLGSCLCGAVEFLADPPLREVIACHCTQCRKTSGHFWAATAVPMERFRITRDDGLAWYRSSDSARRGFCRDCGASLFWKPEGEDRISFAAGALDGPTGTTTSGHIFTGDAGDYYAPEGPPPPPRAAPDRLTASCLCGEVAFSVPRPDLGPSPDDGVIACHCTQCRKLSGHYAASFAADETEVVFSRRGTLSEFGTPAGGRRGFCTGCGSSLYFRAATGAFSVEAGCIDGPTGSTLSRHIFVADKGDYYSIDDQLPRFPGDD